VAAVGAAQPFMYMALCRAVLALLLPGADVTGSELHKHTSACACFCHLVLLQVFSGGMTMPELIKRVTNRHFRLNLVCEHCMRPVGDGYAIEKREEWTVKLLPALKVSFQVARAYNLAAGLGRFMFPVLPVIPPDLMDAGDELLRSLKGVKSSVEDFACIKVGGQCVPSDANQVPSWHLVPISLMWRWMQSTAAAHCKLPSPPCCVQGELGKVAAAEGDKAGEDDLHPKKQVRSPLGRAAWLALCTASMPASSRSARLPSV
jgi:hypothetical protein